MNALLSELKIFQSEPQSLTFLIINMGVGVVLSLILRWHYRKYGSPLSNREEFAQIFPFILLTTLLIIFVVKSSLALSLGLVGALSIVRFRTPIKEPEELAYLFIAIAIGLGLGANQTVVTILAAIIILIVMSWIKNSYRVDGNKNLYLSIDLSLSDEEKINEQLERLNSIITEFSLTCDLRRFDIQNERLEANYYIDFDHIGEINNLVEKLRQNYPEVGISFLDQQHLPKI